MADIRIVPGEGKIQFSASTAGTAYISASADNSITIGSNVTASGNVRLTGGTSATDPIPQLKFDNYFDNSGKASPSHINLYNDTIIYFPTFVKN